MGKRIAPKEVFFILLITPPLQSTHSLDRVPEIWILQIGHILKRILIPVYHDSIDHLSGVLSLVSLDQSVSADQACGDEASIYFVNSDPWDERYVHRAIWMYRELTYRGAHFD